jgi:hypothetical protein
MLFCRTRYDKMVIVINRFINRIIGTHTELNLDLTKFLPSPVGVDSSLPAMDRRMFRNISELRRSSAKTPLSLIAEELSRRKFHGKWRGLLLREILLLASRILAKAPATPTARLATVRSSSSLSKEKDLWRGNRSLECLRSLFANVKRLLSAGSRRLETQLTLLFIRLV